MTTTLRSADPVWRATYLAADTRWNMDVLHALGHPVTPAEWYFLEALRDSGATVEEAVQALAAKRAES